MAAEEQPTQQGIFDSQTNLFTGGMNMDADPLFIKPDTYMYAENFRLTKDGDGVTGVLENVPGNHLFIDLTTDRSYFPLTVIKDFRLWDTEAQRQTIDSAKQLASDPIPQLSELTDIIAEEEYVNGEQAELGATLSPIVVIIYDKPTDIWWGQFKGWYNEAGTQLLSEDNPYKFTVTKATTVRAVYAVTNISKVDYYHSTTVVDGAVVYPTTPSVTKWYLDHARVVVWGDDEIPHPPDWTFKYFSSTIHGYPGSSTFWYPGHVWDELPYNMSLWAFYTPDNTPPLVVEPNKLEWTNDQKDSAVAKTAVVSGGFPPYKVLGETGTGWGNNDWSMSFNDATSTITAYPETINQTNSTRTFTITITDNK